MSPPARPDLHFESLADMMADVDRLRSRGYEKLGKWDLAMILNHLGKSIGGPLRSGWIFPWPLGPMARFAVHRFARRKKYTTFRIPVPKIIRPEPGISVETAYRELADVVAKVEALLGPIVICPPFGRVTSEDFRKVMLLHAAHHLGFLKPA